MTGSDAPSPDEQPDDQNDEENQEHGPDADVHAEGDTPSEPAEPLPLMSDDDIVTYARGVITQEYMLADVRDRDWEQSLMLLICGLDPMPPNASTLFLVPMGPHMSGRWLNGRVPALTFTATMVPMENVRPLVAKCDEFYKFLHPEVSSESTE